MKSFRNLILSLLLAAGAAGLAACEGERGPVGEAGPTGTAGVAGPKGAAGDPGRSSDEIPNAYDFLKNWGKADGMAACNDDIFDKTKMAAFPGPAALAKSAGTSIQRLPIPGSGQTTVTLQVNIGDPDASGNADKGECSDKVFIVTAGTGSGRTGAPFTFTPTRVGEKMTETKSGTTPVLGNRTLTLTERSFWGGMVAVDLKADAAAAEGTDRLAVRCDGRKRPVDVTGGKQITGEYRIATVEETENILEENNGVNVIKDSDTTSPANDYKLTHLTTRVCIRLASVPGTVKCLVKTVMEERDANNDDKAAMATQTTRKMTVKEQVALYRGGQLMQVMPMPYSDGYLAGTAPAGTPTGGLNPQDFPWTNTPNDPSNFPPGKLCNFFDKGVIPCPDGEVPGDDGACAAPSP